MSELELIGVLPSIIVASGAFLLVLLYVLGVLTAYRGFIYCSTLVFAALASVWQGLIGSNLVFESSVFVDPFSAFYSFSLLLAALFCAFLTFGQLEKQDVKHSLEFDVLQLCAVLGGLLMIQASNMILLFVGFELLSIAVYVLCGSAITKKASAESALKYFMMGAFSSAFLLYGMALVYGSTGSFSYYEIAARADMANPLLVIGIAMLIFGFAFKVSVAPFHIWTPDVYQGAPSSVTAFMAVVVKIAAFGAFLRVFSVAFLPVASVWIDMIWVLAVISMTVGNLMALTQKSIKRMLTYSSIAHAGYMLMGFLVFGAAGGAESATFYLIAYTFMTISSFGCVILVTSGTGYQYENDTIDSFKGISTSRPYTALAMTISMLALAGMPPLVGFFGKFLLFTSGVSGGYTGLIVIAALNSVVSLYYYLRIIVVMYFQDEDSNLKDKSKERVSSYDFMPSLAVAGSTLCVILLGLYGQPLYQIVQIVFP